VAVARDGIDEVDEGNEALVLEMTTTVTGTVTEEAAVVCTSG